MPWVSLASRLWGAYKRRGGIFTGQGEAWGWYSVIFSSQLHVPMGRRDFCPQLALIRSVIVFYGAWWALLTCKANSMVRTAEWATATFGCKRFLLSLPFFVCYSGYPSKGPCFPLSVYGPLAYKMDEVISCHLASAPFLCSHLATYLL